MKFKIDDQVIVTTGKDKGVKSVITQVFPQDNKVLVKDVNFYVKHVKPIPMMNRPGERTRQERPIHVGKIAILNEKGEPDRIGYKMSEDGKKQRVYKKTGTLIKKQKPASDSKKKKQESSKKTTKKEKKSSK